MRIIVTCGPSSEPIDEVRSLTNFSTGELGVLLCQQFQEHGYEVICLRSLTATYPLPDGIATMIPFLTNDDLERELKKLSAEKNIAAIFHAAALCDYRVEKVTSSNDQPLAFGKIPTGLGPLTMRLQPTHKLIASLREWFPTSLLVGWKYEVDGTIDDAVARAREQVKKYQLDASIANGKAFGAGFEFIPATRRPFSSLEKTNIRPFAESLDAAKGQFLKKEQVNEMNGCATGEGAALSSKKALAEFLATWLESERRF